MFKPVENTFLYFAYGSNLLKRRIRINNESAEFMGCGRLDGHRLDFIKFSTNWLGTSATIVPTDNAHIWGAIWRLNNADMAALDKQEGVHKGWYFPKEVDVFISDGLKVKCRTYQQVINPKPLGKGEILPEERRPSITYLECIVRGATECKLPKYYIEQLEKIPHNGRLASLKMIESLERIA